VEAALLGGKLLTIQMLGWIRAWWGQKNRGRQ